VRKEQVLQEEAYPAIQPPVDAQNPAIPWAILSTQNGRRPVRDQAEPPCKISREIGKARAEKSVNIHTHKQKNKQ